MTITEKAKEVLQVVKKLSSATSFSELKTWSQEQGLNKETFLMIWNTLKESFLLVQGNLLDKKQEKGIFFNLLAFEEKVSAGLRSDLPYPYFDHAILEGKRMLFDVVLRLLAQSRKEVFAHQGKERPLYLFCCDDNSYEPAKER